MPLPSMPDFPTYLVPSLPFRRRQSSADSSVSTSLSDTFGSSPADQTFLSSASSYLRCVKCLSDLALSSQIISKGFTGRHGRAYLVAPCPSSISSSSTQLSNANARDSAQPNLPNTFTDRPVPRTLVTGPHTVSDIHCSQCGLCLGWKYIAAEEDSQKYKVGKFILETKRVCRSNMWELQEHEELDLAAKEKLAQRQRSSANPPNEIPTHSAAVQDEIEFDSQDEDECEYLFMGIWTPQLAAKRRRSKRLVA